MCRIGIRHASRSEAKRVSAYLHRKHNELAAQATRSAASTASANNNFLQPNKRYLSDGGEALSQLMNSINAATESLLLPPPSLVSERPSHWYAVQTSPRHEKRVREHLGRRGVGCFLPLFRSIHRWKNGCKVQVELPLFPGYLFVNIPRTERVRVLSVPGVLSFVGPKGEPARLSDFEIETLRSGLHLQ